MIKFKPLEISDKELFDGYFNLTDYKNSEKNFSNIYIWRDYYEYEYDIIDGFLCIKGKFRENNDYFCHVPYGEGDNSQVISILEEYFKNNGFQLILWPVLLEMEDSIKGFNFKEKRNCFDYIYTSEKLINLKGPKLRNKRRWVKKFKENYDYTYETITKSNIYAAKKFTINLIKNSNNNKYEIKAMEEMFDNFFTLKIKGCIIKVDGKIAGVSTGEELTKDTIIIHCERCNRSYEGIYNVINQEFVKNQWSDYKYINREQDLGIKGLRQSKLTYRPDILLKKSTGKIND